jgi:hypothetical protein
MQNSHLIIPTSYWIIHPSADKFQKIYESQAELGGSPSLQYVRQVDKMQARRLLCLDVSENFVMTNATAYASAPDLSPEDYVVIGLATCFVKEDGEVRELQIIEPIPSAALEAIAKGIPTSYKLAVATTLGEVLVGDKLQTPAGFPDLAQFSDDFGQRAIAAARTYKSRTAAQSLIPLGTTRADFNYSTERKRVLNLKRVVSKDDNVKQHAYTHQVL